SAQTAPPSDPPQPSEPPYSVERIKEALEERPLLVLNLQGLPVFRVEIIERRPRTFELPDPVHIPWDSRPSARGWHNEFLTMVTPEVARPYSPMLTTSEKLQIAGTSLSSLGVIELATAAVHRLREARQRAREAEAREEVDEAL